MTDDRGYVSIGHSLSLIQGTDFSFDFSEMSVGGGGQKMFLETPFNIV